MLGGEQRVNELINDDRVVVFAAAAKVANEIEI